MRRRTRAVAVVVLAVGAIAVTALALGAVAASARITGGAGAGGRASSVKGSAHALQFRPEIPRTWAAEDVAAFELPLASPEHSPVHVPEDYYYSLPVRPVYRSYPIYHPDREPDGYRERLLELEPEVVFDEARLATEEDWIAAGADVFAAPIAFDGPVITPVHVDDPGWYDEVEVALTPDGVMPFARWVIRERGRLEVGNLACAMCHIRVLPDGSVLDGAQGNFPLDGSFARDLAGPLPLEIARAVTRELTAAPWVGPDPAAGMSKEELAAAFAAVPAGVIIRQGTGLFSPARVPDLIGIADREYLDATGLVLHRSIGDLMRYAAANQTLDMLARYGDYIPTGIDERRLPEPGEGTFVGTADRYSDAQLYALARYIYSLEPPPSPHPIDDTARRGRQVFQRLRCDRCHTPPLYTSNRIIPVPGFEPPAEHLERHDVLETYLGTDPTLALTTRRGTGYYKVPSLKGLWYRGPLEHNGSVATLEDWFDPRRLEDDYVPSGYAGPGGGPRPVPGHLFGLSLSDEERAALIAFLRTL